jgi:hypothetical protein
LVEELYLLGLDATESRLLLLLSEDDEGSPIFVLGVDCVHAIHAEGVMCGVEGWSDEKGDDGVALFAFQSLLE